MQIVRSVEIPFMPHFVYLTLFIHHDLIIKHMVLLRVGIHRMYEKSPSGVFKYPILGDLINGQAINELGITMKLYLLALEQPMTAECLLSGS